MKFGNKDDVEKLDEFVGMLDGAFKEFKKHMKYIRDITPESNVIEDGMKILKKKINRMKDCESVAELGEHIKIKKVLKDSDKNNEIFYNHR